MSTITLPVSAIERIEKNLKRALVEISVLKKQKIRKSSKPIRFWTEKEWEEAEQEADEDIKAGRVYGPFKNVAELVKGLHREAKALDNRDV